MIMHQSYIMSFQKSVLINILIKLRLWNTFLLSFADIIKVVIIIIKKVERIRNYVSKFSLYQCFLIQQNLLISCEKMRMSAELKDCFIFRWGISVPSFIIVGYIWKILERGWLFAQPHTHTHLWATPKCPSWIGHHE